MSVQPHLDLVSDLALEFQAPSSPRIKLNRVSSSVSEEIKQIIKPKLHDELDVISDGMKSLSQYQDNEKVALLNQESEMI